MAKKASDEDQYFRQCQNEARKKKQHQANNKDAPMSKADTTARETELFGKQIVKGINFEKYNEIKVEVKVPDGSTANNTVSPMENFANLNHLTPQLKKNIQLMKYSHPTPIQKNAIPMVMAGEDLMCCAQTGSGKTCAFLLPVVAHLLEQQQQQHGQTANNNNSQTENALEPAKPKCVVLAPTRELASQIELEAQKLTHAIPTLQPVVVYGGANARSQLKELAIASGSENDLIVVATPGRLTDFVDRNLVSLSEVRYLILDEADRKSLL
jgi:superfamily II DNA/RNA helicase